MTTSVALDRPPDSPGHRGAASTGAEAHQGAWHLADHLCRHFARPGRLTELGRPLGWTAFQTIRAFRRAFGLTPGEYLQAVRVAHAKRLIEEGRPLTEVAFEVGFCDQSHLTRVFKRVDGRTPGAYVRRRCARRLR